MSQAERDAENQAERLRALELELDDVVVAAIVGGLDHDTACTFIRDYAARALAGGSTVELPRLLRAGEHHEPNDHNSN